MYKQNFKYWGDFMMDANEGKKQLENMANWVNFGFGGFEDLTTMFRKFCGLDWMSELKDTPDYSDIWKMIMKDYTQSFHDYLSLTGLVSKDEHLALISKYKDLKKTVNGQEKEILAQDDRAANQKKQISSMKATITKQKNEIENKKKIAAGQKRESLSQNREMENQKKQVADQRGVIAAQKKEVAVQKKIIADQRKEIAAQKKMVADQKKEISNGLAAIKQLQSNKVGKKRVG